MKKIFGILLALLITQTPSPAQNANYNPPELQKINVVEHLGETIPLSLHFINDSGDTVQLKDYFYHGKPVILVLAYYNCPMLCSMVLNGVSEAAKAISLQPGQDYTILTISIDPTETWELAAAKKKNYVASLGEKANPDGWIFFASEEDQVKTLADSLGFVYYYDNEKEQYAHPAVVHILTDSARVSRYLYGIEFNPNDFKISLLEASRGKIGNSFDKILLYCFHYDPDSKGYVVLAGNVMRLGGLVTLVLLVLFIGMLWARYRIKKNK